MKFNFNFKKFKIAYYALIDAYKKEMPIRYKPENNVKI